MAGQTSGWYEVVPPGTELVEQKTPSPAQAARLVLNVIGTTKRQCAKYFRLVQVQNYISRIAELIQKSRMNCRGVNIAEQQQLNNK